MEEEPIRDKEKKIQVILIIVLVAISVGAILGLTVLSETTEQGPTVPVLSTTYSGISPENASKLIESNEHFLTIIDCRNCKCNFNKDHLFNATWDIDPMSFNDTKNDLLVYDNNEEKSLEFCEQLVGHTWGAIYYLEGGIDAWKNAGYDYWKTAPS